MYLHSRNIVLACQSKAVSAKWQVQQMRYWCFAYQTSVCPSATELILGYTRAERMHRNMYFQFVVELEFHCTWISGRKDTWNRLSTCWWVLKLLTGPVEVSAVFDSEVLSKRRKQGQTFTKKLRNSLFRDNTKRKFRTSE